MKSTTETNNGSLQAIKDKKKKLLKSLERQIRKRKTIRFRKVR